MTIGTPSETRKDIGLLLIRIMVGIVFMFHGSQKLFGIFDGPGLGGFAGYLESLGMPFPFVNSILAACAEFFGGLALLLGFGFPWINIPVAFTMLVAAYTHWGAFSVQSNGMEYPLTLAFIVIGLAFTGAGQYRIWNCCKSKPVSTNVATHANEE